MCIHLYLYTGYIRKSYYAAWYMKHGSKLNVRFMYIHWYENCFNCKRAQPLFITSLFQYPTTYVEYDVFKIYPWRLFDKNRTIYIILFWNHPLTQVRYTLQKSIDKKARVICKHRTSKIWILLLGDWKLKIKSNFHKLVAISGNRSQIIYRSDMSIYDYRSN